MFEIQGVLFVTCHGSHDTVVKYLDSNRCALWNLRPSEEGVSFYLVDCAARLG